MHSKKQEGFVKRKRSLETTCDTTRNNRKGEKL